MIGDWVEWGREYQGGGWYTYYIRIGRLSVGWLVNRIKHESETRYRKGN